MDQPTKSRFLEYLPAIFQSRQQALIRATPESAETVDKVPFLQNFLLPFERIFDDYDALLSALDRYVSPELTPTDDFLPWLAAWVALLLDEEWDEDQRRRLVGEAIELYRWRGTEHGLKRYLQLYTGLPANAFDFYEAEWPAGMQIDVASQIGAVRLIAGNAHEEGLNPDHNDNELMMEKQDFYVVDTIAPLALPSDLSIPTLPEPGDPVRLYFCVQRVEQVDLEENGVRLSYRVADGKAETLFYPKMTTNSRPNIQRRSELTHYHYHYRDLGEHGTTHAFTGSTFFVERIPLPYRFVIRVRVPEEQFQEYTRDERKLAKIRTILDLEKPAHTEYYLQLVPEARQMAIAWMQIEVHSDIGLDTTIG